MCFSNLPVKFDEEGNPYLTDEADDVERVDGCGTDVAIDESDPEAVYEAVLSSVPESVREEIKGGNDDGRDEPATGDAALESRHGDSVESD